MDPLFLIILGIIIGILCGVFLGRVLTYRAVRMIRKEAVKNSHSVILGGVYEKVLPALPDFPFAPKDMVFLGKGVDYVIFDGLSEGNLREIVFLELKSGKSRLNANEQRIRECVQQRKIRFTEYRIGSQK